MSEKSKKRLGAISAAAIVLGLATNPVSAAVSYKGSVRQAVSDAADTDSPAIQLAQSKSEKGNNSRGDKGANNGQGAKSRSDRGNNPPGGGNGRGGKYGS